MIDPQQKLNPNVFSPDVEQSPIRKGFGEGLLEAGKKDVRIVGLCADLTESTQMHLFKEAFPNRFIEIGVAEQNLATVAAGMAAMGKIPFFSSYAMFSPGRNWEQIRTTIAYNDVPAIVVGSHAGVSVGPDGGTHQAIEDIALMRIIPNMAVISPCDAVEAKKATLALAANPRPAYLRLAREKTPIITTAETPFELGKVSVLYRSEQPVVAIVATGGLVHRALVAAKNLDAEGIGSVVINVHTIKPFDTEGLLGACSGVKGIVSVEEHQIAGGLGSVVAETLATRMPMPMRFIGVHDKFGQSGTPDELIRHYGMDETAIVAAAKELAL
jgi:transketolase